MNRIDSIIAAIIAAILICTLFALLPGCGRLGKPTIPDISAEKIENMSARSTATLKAVYKTNWMLTVAVAGATASVFAMMMGFSKLGLAGLVSSFACVGMTIAMIRFSGLFAIGGLLVGLGTAVSALVRNKATIIGFIDGFQDVKKSIFHSNTELKKKVLNEVMGSKLTPEGERIVKEHKARAARGAGDGLGAGSDSTHS